jgi:hypothetical protein
VGSYKDLDSRPDLWYKTGDDPGEHLCRVPLSLLP